MKNKMQTLESAATAGSQRPDVRTGTVHFLGVPAFAIEVWQEDQLWVVRPTELDLIASAPTEQEAVQKLGCMIEDLLFFLVQEIDHDDLTDSEQETLHLILSRIGPPVLELRRQQRRHARRQRLRRLFRSPVEWRVGPLSTREGSSPALSV